MKVENLIVKKEKFNDNEFYSLFIVIEGKEYRIGTLRDTDRISYINCIHREYKKN